MHVCDDNRNVDSQSLNHCWQHLMQTILCFFFPWSKFGAALSLRDFDLFNWRWKLYQSLMIRKNTLKPYVTDDKKKMKQSTHRLFQSGFYTEWYFCFFIFFFCQASGNKVSRKTVLCGSQNIVLNGKVIVQTGAIIRGDLSNVRTGRYCVISQKAVIRPAYKQFSTGWDIWFSNRISALLNAYFPF